MGAGYGSSRPLGLHRMPFFASDMAQLLQASIPQSPNALMASLLLSGNPENGVAFFSLSSCLSYVDALLPVLCSLY